MKFEISVIIPVYNVERFIKKTIQSALDQSQVREVIVIDDGSTDRTRDIVVSFDDTRIKLLYHYNNINKGRSATRNLGLSSSSSNYIAFLDGDDFYLPNRFDNDELIFEANAKCDGVYNAVSFYHHNSSTTGYYKSSELTTISKFIAPQELGVELVRGMYGHIHLNGLTLKNSKRDFIEFSENLPVAEDTAWIWQLAFTKVLLPGLIRKPIAMRCIHDNNIFNNRLIYHHYEQDFFNEMIDWSLRHGKDLKTSELFVERLWITINKNYKGVMKLMYTWILTFIPRPRLFFSVLSYRYFPLIYKWKNVRKKLTQSIK